MDPDSIFRQHQSQDQSQQEDSTGQINIKNIRERFLNALKEVERLEKIIENKNKLLTTAEKEKERLLQRLNMALEDKKRLYNRLADFDIIRNMEILELKQGAKMMLDERKRLLKENESLIEEVFEKDKTIDELRFQLQEAQINLDTAIETLKKVESKYNNLEANYKVIEQERDDLKEKLSGAELREHREKGVKEGDVLIKDIESRYNELETNYRTIEQEKDKLKEELSMMEQDLIQKTKAEAESEISFLSSLLEEEKKEEERLNNEIINLGKALQLKEQELLSKDQVISKLKEQREKDISGYQATIERLTAERDEFNFKLIEAEQEKDALQGRLDMITEELAQKAEAEAEHRNKVEELNNLIADLRNEILLLSEEKKKEEERLSKIPRETEKITEKEMIYVEPRRFRWIKKVAVGIVVLIILGIGGMLIVDRFDIIERISFQKSTSPPVERPWLAEGPRQVNTKEFTITLTYLGPKLPENHSYYLLEIKPVKILYGLKAENNCIPEDFINSLSDRCSFISSNGTLIKTKVPEGIDTGRKIIYRTHACDEKRGAIFFRHFIYIEKNYKPQGIMIEGLAKDLPVIIR